MNHEREIEVAVVGGGPSGIGAAIRLRQAGLHDFVLLEKGHELGGTWRDNTYPGCACDVPSALYSYSFAPNPEWSRAFAEQGEIRRYLLDVAKRHQIEEHVQFGAEMRAARWNEDSRRWTIETTRGRYSARFLIVAAGPWHEPNVPKLPGLDAFVADGGVVFHSARWDHSYSLADKRVAVIGTGASAVQFVPRIQKVVGRLHLFQRTAQWVLPKPDHHVASSERWLMRTFPPVQRALRAAEYASMEALGLGFRHPRLLKWIERLAERHLERTIRDPELRRRLTPQYTIGCKRLLLSNSYYPALAKPNVEVHATAVASIDGRRVVGADGSSAEVDALIFATGFHILEMPVAGRVFDGEGSSMADHWQGSPRAYYGTSVSGFPNCFTLLGPNVNTGHTSAFTVLEAQLEHVVEGIRKTRGAGASRIEVKRAAEEAFNAEVQAALRGTVYNAGGCSSYYLDANGRNAFAWPWSTPALERRLRAFDLGAYDLDARPRKTGQVRNPAPKIAATANGASLGE